MWKISTQRCTHAAHVPHRASPVRAYVRPHSRIRAAPMSRGRFSMARRPDSFVAQYSSAGLAMMLSAVVTLMYWRGLPSSAVRVGCS